MQKYLANGEKIEVIDRLLNGKWLVNRREGIEIRDEIDLLDIVDEIYVLTPESEPEASEKLAERIEKLKKYNALKNIEDFIDGKISYYVAITPQECEIILAKEKGWEDIFPGGKRCLLSLFGNSEGDLTWGLYNSPDIMHCYRKVIPFCSYDDAKAFVQKHFDTLRALNAKLAETAEKNGIIVKPELWKAFCEQQRKFLEIKQSELMEVKNKTQSEINKIIDQINEIESLLKRKTFWSETK